MLRRIPFALFITALAAAPGAHAVPDAPPDTAHVLIDRSTYLPGDEELGATTLYMFQGDALTVTNLETVAAHSLTSDRYIDQATGVRLFDSEVLEVRVPTPVQGVEALAPGSYRFHCSVHDYNMRGTLVVLGR